MLQYKFVAFLGSFLLFQVEIIIGRILLPLHGGSFHVWTTCLMFYQGMLFLGYFYADFVLRRFALRTYSKFHLALLFLTAFSFPISVHVWKPGIHPVLDILQALFGSIGLSFFVLATTSPVIQKWFTQSESPERDNPYFLYAASNWGALSSLLLYPILFDPFLTVRQQLVFWYSGYGVYVLAHLFCLPRRKTEEVHPPFLQTQGIGRTISPTFYQRTYWLLLTASGTALLLAVTNAITLDIASVPLLWIIPLAIYLLTFILNFKQRPWYPKYLIVTSLAAIAILIPCMASFPETWFSMWAVLLYCLILFLGCMICHRNLFLAKPVSTQHLTQYYLYIGLGGWCGSILISVVIPVLARHIAITTLDCAVSGLLIFTCLLLRDAPKIKASVQKHKAISLMLCFVFLAGISAGTVQLYSLAMKETVFSVRNFYGIYKIQDNNGVRVFIHGSTVNGKQYLDPQKQNRPLSYYHPNSPIGKIFRMEKPFKNIAVVGLGIGSLTTYSKKGQQWDTYELDPDVVEMAQRYFTHLQHSQVTPRIIIGDGRLQLEKAENHIYDLLILDVFSSDSIPVHFMTQEALKLYLDKLAPDGLLIYHISNRYLNLAVILTSLARTFNLPCAYQFQRQVNLKEEESVGIWFAMSRDRQTIQELISKYGWTNPYNDPSLPCVRAWTDDYVNILTALLNKYK